MTRRTIAFAATIVLLIPVYALLLFLVFPPVARGFEQRRLAGPIAATQRRVSAAVSVGSSRSAAESRMTAANIHYERLWRGATPVDYLLVGHIPSGTWVCSDSEAGVEVVFSASAGLNPPTASPSDIVTAVRTFEWPEACL